MPKLVLFAACERVLIDQQNMLSLVGVIQELKVQVPESGQVPSATSSAPIKWDVITQWAKLPDDTGKNFEQRIAMFNPAGQATAVSAVAALDLSGTYNRTIATVLGFPIGTPGRHTIKLWLSENGKETEHPLAEYWIDIVFDVLRKQ